MDCVDFTDDEIFAELASLGYSNIPKERFQEFKQELFDLIREERSQSISSQNSLITPDSANSGMQSASGANQNSLNAGATDSQRSYQMPNESRVTRPMDGASARDLSVVSNPAGHNRPTSVIVPEIGAGEPQRRVIKRKVLHKSEDGQVSICESVSSSDAGEVSSLYDRLRNVVLSSERPVSAPPTGASTNRCSEQLRPHTACREPSCYNLPEDYDGPKAVIRPISCDPHTRGIKKADPVLRYQKYQQCWTACRAPGEKAHKQLRWGIREQMLYHDEVVTKRPQRSYVPNSYVVPSDKKRKTLRWQIRNDLAQGIKPPSVFD